MVTLAGDACGVKKHKETYGEPATEKIVGDRLLTKPLIMTKQAKWVIFLGRIFAILLKLFWKNNILS